MKSLSVLFGILAIVCSILADETIDYKEKVIKEVNEERRNYAKAHNIPNMYQLEWDNDLEAKAKAQDFEGRDKSYRQFFRDGNEAAIKYEQNNQNHYGGESQKTELIDAYKPYNVVGMEQLTPHQKKIGCAQGIEYTVKHDEAADSSVWQTLCLIGPEGMGESWNVTQASAGSACSEGYENNDGLCAPITKSSSSSDSGQSSTEQSPDDNNFSTVKSPNDKDSSSEKSPDGNDSSSEKSPDDKDSNPEGATESNGNSYDTYLLTIVIVCFLVMS